MINVNGINVKDIRVSTSGITQRASVEGIRQNM